MATADPLRDLELLVRSRYGLIVFETVEIERAETLLRHLADRLDLPYFSWTATGGLRRHDAGGAVYGTVDPSGALAHLIGAQYPAVYHFAGLGGYLEDRRVAAALRDAASLCSRQPGAVVLTGPSVELPASTRPLAATLAMPGPDRVAYLDLIHGVLDDVRTRQRVTVKLAPDDLNRLVNNLNGLTLMEAEKILTRVVVEDGRLDADDIRRVAQAKREIVEREGLLEYFPVDRDMGDIADLAGLKSWLRKRRKFITEPERAKEFGLALPKGMLLLGVPGCGKSLCAKAVAMQWGLPLLKLDPSNLYNKYIGESERNFKRAMVTAEKMAPVVLWIDELEKAFASGGDEDGGVSQRILGTFLSWMQDRCGDVFVVATANDVSRLPPEFLRKGRFDEIFFVDLPDLESREAILRIHLQTRGQDPEGFDLARLAAATDGYSGAEVEQIVVSALYTAFAARATLNDEHLLKEISITRPIAQTMREKIAALRTWARDRTISAH